MNDELNGEQVETPGASSAQITTPDNGAQVNQEGAQNQSTEEASWNNLSGNAQDRFRTVTRENNDYRARLEQVETEMRRMQFGGGVPTPNSLIQSQITPEVQSAVQQLSNYGIATKSDAVAAANEIVDQKLGGLVYNLEMDRLTQRHGGQDGLPVFDKDEYENFVARYPQYRNYSPEDVYEKMYSDEILDYRIKNKGVAPRSASASLKPTRVRVQEESLTPDLVEQKLASLPQAERQRWYEQNIDKINAAIGRVSSQGE